MKKDKLIALGVDIGWSSKYKGWAMVKVGDCIFAKPLDCPCFVFPFEALMVDEAGAIKEAKAALTEFNETNGANVLRFDVETAKPAKKRKVAKCK